MLQILCATVAAANVLNDASASHDPHFLLPFCPFPSSQTVHRKRFASDLHVNLSVSVTAAAFAFGLDCNPFTGIPVAPRHAGFLPVGAHNCTFCLSHSVRVQLMSTKRGNQASQQRCCGALSGRFQKREGTCGKKADQDISGVAGMSERQASGCSLFAFSLFP